MSSIFIFGLLYYCNSYFDKTIDIYIPQEREALKLKKKGDSGFIIQSIMWCLIGVFLFFIPPAIIFNDAQEIIAQLGISLPDCDFGYNPTTPKKDLQQN